MPKKTAAWLHPSYAMAEEKPGHAQQMLGVAEVFLGMAAQNCSVAQLFSGVAGFCSGVAEEKSSLVADGLSEAEESFNPAD